MGAGPEMHPSARSPPGPLGAVVTGRDEPGLQGGSGRRLDTALQVEVEWSQRSPQQAVPQSRGIRSRRG